MRIVVIGGGFGGLASALRLAKLGHQVTLAESSDRLGGAVTTVEADGFAWDAGPRSVALPAVVRDLFRKTGRPLESELGGDLTPLAVLREHRFADGSILRLPPGAGAQRAAFERLAPGLGEAWAAYLAPYAEVWDVLRRHYFEEPWTPAALPREVAALLDARITLRRRLRTALRDERAALVAGHGFTSEGHRLRDVPVWAGVHSYLEQLFGTWTIPDADGGLARVRDLLAGRLSTRGVQVHLDTPVRDIVVRDGRAVAVDTAAGELPADAVVCAIDPRRLPALSPHVKRTAPARAPTVTHLGVTADTDDVGGGTGAWPEHETVLHHSGISDTIVLRPGGRAPDGTRALTLLVPPGSDVADPVAALAARGLDLRGRVVARVERSPAQIAAAGSPYGVVWDGRGTVRRRLGPATPIPGVYAAGAHATPGSGLAYVGLGAALVATLIGPAEKKVPPRR